MLLKDAPREELFRAVRAVARGEAVRPPAVTARPPGRTKISRLDVRSGATRLLGVLPPLIDYGCQTDGTVIACVTTDEQLIVTDVG